MGTEREKNSPDAGGNATESIGLEAYRNIVEMVNSIILRLDPTGVITFINEYGRNFFGYSAEEIMSRRVIGTIVPETEASGRDLTAMVEDLIANPTRYVTNENENIKKNGERAWISWTNRAVTDGQGRLVAVLCVGNDITERKRAEEALEERNHFLQQLIDAIPNPVYYKDFSGVYLGCNRAFQEFVGRTKEEIVGKSIFDIMPADLANTVYERDNALIRRTGVRSYEGEYRFHDGSRRDVVFNIATFSNREGKVAGLVGVIFDLTVRKRAEGSLMESERKLRGIVGNSLDGIVLVSEKGLITEWNGVMESLTGFGKVDVIGHPLWEMLFLLLPEDKRLPGVKDRMTESISDYFVTGEAPWLGTPMKTFLQDSHGDIKTVRQLSFKLRTGEGFMLGIFFHEMSGDSAG